MKPHLFAATVEREQDGVFIIEINPEDIFRPRVVYANPAFFLLTGFGPDGVEAGLYPRLIGPDTNRKLIEDCAARVMDGQAVQCEVQLYREDATSFWASVRSHPLDDPAHYCVLILRDVTQQRVAARRMRLLSQALEEASDLVLITDASASPNSLSEIVYANQAFQDATGYALHEVIGRSGFSFYAKESDPIALEAMKRNIELGLRNEKEAIVRRKDGSTFWIEIVGKPFVDARDEHTYRIIIGRDITLRKRSMNEVTLLLGAAEGSSERIVLYERDASGVLAVVYENAAASASGRYRLLELLEPGLAYDCDAYARLARGEQHVELFMEENASNDSEIHEFTARSIRNTGGTVDAAVTVERRIQEHLYRQIMTDR